MASNNKNAFTAPSKTEQDRIRGNGPPVAFNPERLDRPTTARFRPGGQAEAEQRRIDAAPRPAPVLAPPAAPVAAPQTAPPPTAGPSSSAVSTAPVAAANAGNSGATGQAPRINPGASTASRNQDEPLFTTAYVAQHEATEDFHHRGKGWWARGLPAREAPYSTACRGPGAAGWKARATADYQAKKAQGN